MFPAFSGLGVTEAIALGYAPTPKARHKLLSGNQFQSKL
jgi:hypothetical protein